MTEVPLSFLKGLNIEAANKIMDAHDSNQPKSQTRSNTQHRRSQPSRSTSSNRYNEGMDENIDLITEEQMISMGVTPSTTTPYVGSYDDDAVMNSGLPENIKAIMTGVNRLNIPEPELPDLSNVRRDIMFENKQKPTNRAQQRTSQQSGLSEDDVRRILREESMSLVIALVKEREEEIRTKAVKDTLSTLKKRGLLLKSK